MASHTIHDLNGVQHLISDKHVILISIVNDDKHITLTNGTVIKTKASLVTLHNLFA
jgi:hypothetical protein